MPSAIASFTPPALLLGLGARVLSDKFSGAEASLSSTVLVGLWQGVGLLYAVQSSDFHLLVLAGIALKLCFDISSEQDVTKIMITVVATGLGFLLTDFLIQMLDESSSSSRSQAKRAGRSSHDLAPANGSPSASRSRRRVRRRSESARGRTDDPRRQAFRQAVSDITSVDTHSELIGPKPRTQLERDIATLRARAALADSERRRYKEETKWALASGNAARAEQMRWQAKRYKALMKSFAREVEAKLSESSAGLSSDQHATSPPPAPPASPPTTKHRASRRTTPALDAGNGVMASSSSSPVASSPTKHRVSRRTTSPQDPGNGVVGSSSSPQAITRIRSSRKHQERERTS